jgi:hypothetical protein
MLPHPMMIRPWFPKQRWGETPAGSSRRAPVFLRAGSRTRVGAMSAPHRPRRVRGGDLLPDARDGDSGRQPRRADHDLPLGDGAGAFPRALGRGGAHPRRGRAAVRAVGLRALPTADADALRPRRCRRRALRASVHQLAAVPEDGPWGFYCADKTAARQDASSPGTRKTAASRMRGSRRRNRRATATACSRLARTASRTPRPAAGRR